MTCDTIKSLEREAAMKFRQLTVEQAFRLADSEKAQAAWSTIAQWTGPKAKITAEIEDSFKRLIAA